MERITSLARQEILALKLLKQLCILWANIISPVLIAIVLTFRETIYSAGSGLFWLLIVSLVFLQISTAVVNLIGGQLIQEAYFEAKNIADENQELKWKVHYLTVEIDYLNTLRASAAAWLEMERQYLELKINSLDQFRDLLWNFLAIVVEAREKFFGVEASELWNFVIYVYSQNLDRLIPVWREKSHLHPSQGLGRHWKPGQGHVGKAFVDCNSKITGDATDPTVANLMAPPASLIQYYDQTVYRSFASIPIKLVNTEKQPFGVLVATSDRVDRFNKANCLILNYLASALANVIHLKQIKYDELHQ